MMPLTNGGANDNRKPAPWSASDLRTHGAAAVSALIAGMVIAVLFVNQLPFVTRSELQAEQLRQDGEMALVRARLTTDEANQAIILERQNKMLDRLADIDGRLIRMETALGDRHDQSPPGG